MGKSNFSRGDFLKLTGYGLAGMFLANQPLNLPQADAFDNLQGRVVDRTIWSYDAPNFKATRKNLYWRDLVVPIKNTAVGEDESAYNRVWYELNEGGYVYSGSVQPVRTILNKPQPIPLKGELGEISVPFTDAYESLEPNAEVVVLHRLYYESVHWVTASAVHPTDRSLWYLLLDDKNRINYYVRGEHVRLLTPEELAPLSSNLALTDKRVEVQLNEQMMMAYEKNNLVFATRTSTGGRLRSGKYTTPDGEFKTFHKRPTRHMSRGDIAASGFDLPGVPWVLYIKKNGISLHGTYWHNDYGRPRSHGCINLTPQAAKWLYRWTLPTVPLDKELAYGDIGTRVDIKIE
jgi:lipoprotein-anchoring transpeptidase ErfK/SrfK